MKQQHFQAEVTVADGGPKIVLAGTLNRSAKEQMEAAYEVAESEDGEVLLDFSHVEYINSTGIAIIVGLLGRARAAGRRVGASGLTDHYREVFEITRLSDFMNIYDDLDTST